MTSLRPDQIITDPLTALSQPSAVEAALASRLGSDPFAMGHSFAARMRREAQAGSLARQQQQANAMRSVLAQRIMQQEAQANALSNIADVRETIGAPGAAQAAGLLPTPFAAARNPVDLAQIQADAQLTASEAAREGAQAGVMPVQSDAFSGVTGFGLQEMVPLGVQEEMASAQRPRAVFFGADGIQYQVPLDPGEVPATFRERIADQAAGVSDANVTSDDAAQNNAIDLIRQRASINGWQQVAPPRRITMDNGQPAIEYEYETPEGRIRYYAIEGDPTPRGALVNDRE